MATVGPITDEQITHVHSHMWERGRDELRRMGYDPGKMLPTFLERNRTPFSFGVFVDGKPVAFMGASKKSENLYSTWFQATDEFNGKATLAVRRFLKATMADHPGTELVLHTASVHPDADRWFACLGFRPLTYGSGIRSFRYEG